MSEPPTARPGSEGSDRPGRARALGAFLAGLLLSPSDLASRAAGDTGRRPVPGEGFLVVTLTLLCLVGGAYAGVQILSGIGGGVVGAVVGIVVSVVPVGMAARLAQRIDVRRRQSQE